ncbi:hypothetical protein ACHAXS_004764 [Conticribra weissflogii]
MGKKRNSSVKRKQAAKTKKLSSSFGVSVLQGGTITRNNGFPDRTSTGIVTSMGMKQKVVASYNNIGKTTKNDISNRSNGGCLSYPSTPQTNHHEHKEFDRLHASLEERSLALQARKNDQIIHKKTRKTQQKKGWGKFARPVKEKKFAPATLNLAPKSTQELIDDAANQVAMGMIEIGKRTAINPFVPCSEASLIGQSSLAAACGMNRKHQASNDQNSETLQTHNENNPFAALDWDSDNDLDGNSSNAAKTVSRLQFQPASFSFQSNVICHPVVGTLNDDFDPDL